MKHAVVTAIEEGRALGLRGLRHRKTVIGSMTLAALAALVAILERRINPLYAPNLALTGAAFGFLLPAAGYLLLERITGYDTLEAPLRTFARYGGHNRWGVVGLLAVAAFGLVLTAVLLETVTLLFTRGLSDPTLVADWLVTTKIAVLAGISYALYFGMASTFGRKGQGRLWALILDWTLGSSAGVVALPWPRGHIRNLLGAEPTLGLSQPAAALSLGLIALVGAAILVWRTPA